MPPVQNTKNWVDWWVLARKVGQHMQEAVLQRNSLTTASGGKVNSCSKWRLASYPDNRRFAYCCQDEKRMSQCACQLMVSFVTSSVIGENRNSFWPIKDIAANERHNDVASQIFDQDHFWLDAFSFAAAETEWCQLFSRYKNHSLWK